jgi:putative endonuclease
MITATNPQAEQQKIGVRKKSIGQRGEDYACLYLERQGFKILERNWTCSRGEADIIAIENDVLVFIEVKTATDSDYGLPEDKVTPAKRRRYENIALCYLASHERPSSQLRFDVIAIVFSNHTQAMLRHHRDAFSSDH